MVNIGRGIYVETDSVFVADMQAKEAADRVTAENDARLIAAAPAMAEALEAALAWEKEVPAPYRDFPFIRAIKAALIAAGYTE